MRLFVGIGLSEEIRDGLARLATGVPGARWTAPENYHLTLRFIGEVDGPVVEDIAECLRAVTAPPLNLQLDGVGYFGDRRRPRVLWAGVAANPDLNALQGRIERRLQGIGIAAESRRYHPHVTLARLRDTPFKRIGTFLEANGAFLMPPFTADRFTLFESRLGSKGAVYLPQIEYPLAAV